MSPTLHGLRQGPRLSLHPTRGDLARHWLAHLLRGASAALARHARQVARPLHARQRRTAAPDPVLEFYAEAGAPEGALYRDGELVGMLDVSRL